MIKGLASEEGSFGLVALNFGGCELLLAELWGRSRGGRCYRMTRRRGVFSGMVSRPGLPDVNLLEQSNNSWQ